MQIHLVEYLDRQLSPNFQVKEFICPCCGEEGIEIDLVLKLQMARDVLSAGGIIRINSGFRCKKHNKKKGGVEDSAHRKGLAVDIRCDHSSYRFYLLQALSAVGFTRIGIGEDFIHCDRDLEKPQNVMWTYY